MSKIKVAIAGVGNCASALVQGVEYYKSLSKNHPEKSLGLMHWNLGGYYPQDIEFVAAFDIDERKVGKDLSEAIFALPNNTKFFFTAVPKTGTKVQMGPVLDGFSAHMSKYPQNQRFVVAKKRPVNVAEALIKSGTEILLIYLPVGSEKAVAHYAEAALQAGVSVINCVPVFIASNVLWAERFARACIPIIGDDIKSQIGATIVHRVLTKLFEDRGVKLDRTYQLNVGGNTDFLNMLNRHRLVSKKISKTEAVQSQLHQQLEDEHIHIGPSDYVPWLKDNKICFIRMEGRIFGNILINLELRLSVEDSPNSGGIVIDAIRCVKLARDRKISGVLVGPSAYFMKHPPVQFSDEEARRMVEKFIRKKT